MRNAQPVRAADVQLRQGQHVDWHDRVVASAVAERIAVGDAPASDRPSREEHADVLSAAGDGRDRRAAGATEPRHIGRGRGAGGRKGPHLELIDQGGTMTMSISPAPSNVVSIGLPVLTMGRPPALIITPRTPEPRSSTMFKTTEPGPCFLQLQRLVKITTKRSRNNSVTPTSRKGSQELSAAACPCCEGEPPNRFTAPSSESAEPSCCRRNCPSSGSRLACQ